MNTTREDTTAMHDDDHGPTQVPAVLTREQLDLLAERIDAGADPQAVARWIARITDRTAEQTADITAAAEDLRRGDGAKWYAAADAAAKESGTL